MWFQVTKQTPLGVGTKTLLCPLFDLRKFPLQQLQPNSGRITLRLPNTTVIALFSVSPDHQQPRMPPFTPCSDPSADCAASFATAFFSFFLWCFFVCDLRPSSARTASTTSIATVTKGVGGRVSATGRRLPRCPLRTNSIFLSRCAARR